MSSACFCQGICWRECRNVRSSKMNNVAAQPGDRGAECTQTETECPCPPSPAPHLLSPAHLVSLRPFCREETGPERLRMWTLTELVSGGSGFEPHNLTLGPTYLTKMLPVSLLAWLGMASSLRMTQCPETNPVFRKLSTYEMPSSSISMSLPGEAGSEGGRAWFLHQRHVARGPAHQQSPGFREGGRHPVCPFVSTQSVQVTRDTCLLMG
uniref:Uncharacterized protein n=1 Tax=Molossus molossus TaxID=27622 RepID=A0A7J8J0L8_MOLMO|nr:hypothetical protein HJG59_010427 [Molossus molossus]